MKPLKTLIVGLAAVLLVAGCSSNAMTAEEAATQIQKDYVGVDMDLSYIYRFMESTCNFMETQKNAGASYSEAKAAMDVYRQQEAEVLTASQMDGMMDLSIRGMCPELIGWAKK